MRRMPCFHGASACHSPLAVTRFGHPFVQEPGILPSADVASVVTVLRARCNRRLISRRVWPCALSTCTLEQISAGVMRDRPGDGVVEGRQGRFDARHRGDQNRRNGLQ